MNGDFLDGIDHAVVVPRDVVMWKRSIFTPPPPLPLLREIFGGNYHCCITDAALVA